MAQLNMFWTNKLIGLLQQQQQQYQQQHLYRSIKRHCTFFLLYKVQRDSMINSLSLATCLWTTYVAITYIINTCTVCSTPPSDNTHDELQTGRELQLIFYSAVCEQQMIECFVGWFWTVVAMTTRWKGEASYEWGTVSCFHGCVSTLAFWCCRPFSNPGEKKVQLSSIFVRVLVWDSFQSQAHMFSGSPTGHLAIFQLTTATEQKKQSHNDQYKHQHQQTNKHHYSSVWVTP